MVLSLIAAPMGAIIGNIFSSVALIMVNKRIIVTDEFEFMTVLSGFHFYTSFLSCCFFLLVGFFRYKAPSSYIVVARIAFGSLASIVFMNLNLAHNSVGFYQLSKLCCIPVTLAMETALGTRQQSLSAQMILSLTVIIIGMVLVTSQEVHISIIGLFWAAASVLATSSAQVFFGPLQRELGMNALQLLFHTSPFLTFGSFAMVPIFENTSTLLGTKVTHPLVLDIACSCVVSVMLNATNYLVLSHVSPLTYQILGHLKTVLIISFGVILFDAVPSHQQTLGMVTVMVGVVIYSREINRQNDLNDNKSQFSPSLSSPLSVSISPSSPSSFYPLSNPKQGGNESADMNV